MKKDARYTAPALDKGLDILEHLSASGVPLSQAEIAQSLGRTPTELFRMLNRLEHRGYIHRHPVSAKYQLSLRLYHLSRTHSPVDALRRAAMHPMQELAETTGHPVHLCVLDQEAVLVITQVRGPNPVSLSIQEGSRFPVERTTSGMLLLACLDETERNAVLERSDAWNSWSAAQRKSFASELARIRKRGHHAAKSAITQGVSDIAALIGSRDGPFLATIAISCVSSLLGRSSDPSVLLDAILSTAAAINRATGFVP